MALRKYREISIEPPESALDAPFPVIEGMRAWKNEKNEFVVVACHYTADPEKRNDEWYTKATSGLRDDQVEREYEINFESKAGTKAFPFLEHNEGIYRKDPPHPIPSHWKIIVSVDYGARNPTAIYWHAVDEHRRFWTFDEFYKPVRDIKGGYVGLAEYLLKHPYYPRAKFITADPSMFNKSQNILVSKENNQKSYGTLMSVVDLLEKEGIYKFQKANNDRIAGLSRMNSMFNFRGEGIKSNPYIFIGKKCNKAWWELNNLVYKLDDSETKNPEEDIVKRNDHCFIAGTKVSIPGGTKEIEKLKVGETVITRKGPMKIISCGQAGIKQTYVLLFTNGSRLVCTANHPIWTENRGFIRADELSYEDICISLKEKKSFLTEQFIEDTQNLRERILGSILEPLVLAKKVLNYCIGIFGSLITAQYQMGMKFITKMETFLITTFQILSAYHQKNMLLNTENITLISGKLINTKKFKRTQESWQRFGMPLKTEERGIVSTQKTFGGKWAVQDRFAIFVKKNFLLKMPRFLIQSSVLMFVGQQIEGLLGLMTLRSLVAFADRFFQKINTQKQKRVRVNVVHLCGRLTAKVEPVFNMTVEEQHEYFAEGILVSNSYDSIRYALMSENLPAEVIHDERAGFATLKAVEDEMEEDYAKKNTPDVFSCKFNELDGESEWDMRDYG